MVKSISDTVYLYTYILLVITAVLVSTAIYLLSRNLPLGVAALAAHQWREELCAWRLPIPTTYRPRKFRRHRFVLPVTGRIQSSQIAEDRSAKTSVLYEERRSSRSAFSVQSSTKSDVRLGEYSVLYEERRSSRGVFSPLRRPTHEDHRTQRG